MSNRNQPKLPLWYRPWLVLPVSAVTLAVLGLGLPLPPYMIDPCKYPAFMDGGTDWGGSNVFFYTRVVMLLMGMMGSLSIPFLKPRPDWQNTSWRGISRLSCRCFAFHIACFVVYALTSLLSDDCGSLDTCTVLFLEIGCWYVVSAVFVVSLLRRGIDSGLMVLWAAVLNVGLLIIGFYVGHWATGAEFNAHMLGTSQLLIRLFIEMLAYLICVIGAFVVIWKIHCLRFLSGL